MFSRTVRLWNIETSMCIATFHGDYGHRDTVLTIDFNHDCSKLVSGGHDHKIAIWDLSEPKLALTIERSHNYDKNSRNNTIKTVFHPFPIFSNRQIHHNYIDCVQWHGDMILSKVNKNRYFIKFSYTMWCFANFRPVYFKNANDCYFFIIFNSQL